jgi:redox-sensitive bicupin YhaK (pirin superfamily)
MSYLPAEQPACHERKGSIELLIEPKLADLGEFMVRRALPSPKRKMVGPFIFFDEMGPAEFPPGKGISVRPHPHIGIATITYLFKGEIIHRDSLGVIQPIRPGAVNLMTAGRGIVHSERAGEDLDEIAPLHGIQSWIALPEDQQERAPDFAHYPASDLPEIARGGATIRVILGEAYGSRSPVKCYSRSLYLDCVLEPEARLSLPTNEQELAVYVVSGKLDIEDQEVGSGVMAVVCPDNVPTVVSRQKSRVMVIGGDHLGGRKIWWNFVHSDPARIERAKADWKAGHFPGVLGDAEFIPLPTD